MGVMHRIITILVTKRGRKRGGVESSFILSTFPRFKVKKISDFRYENPGFFFLILMTLSILLIEGKTKFLIPTIKLIGQRPYSRCVLPFLLMSHLANPSKIILRLPPKEDTHKTSTNMDFKKM